MLHRSIRPSFGAAALLAAAAVLLAGPHLALAADAFPGATQRLMVGDAAGALAAYEAYLAASPQGEYAPLAALAAGTVRSDALQDPAGAIASFDRVLRDYRTSPWASEAARRKGACLEGQKGWAAAGDAYREALDLAATGSTAPSAPATAGDRGPDGGEVDAGASAVESAPAVSAAWINEVSLAAANCYFQLGDRQKVIETYEHALAGSLPGEARATTLYRLGECNENAGDLAQAARRYRAVLENHPLAPEFALALGKRAVIEPHESLDWASYEAFGAAVRAMRQRDFATTLQQCETAAAGTGSEALKQHTEYCRIVAETITSGDYSAGVRQLENLRRRMPRAAVPRQLEQLIPQYQLTADLEAEVAKSPQDAPALGRLGRNYLQNGSLQPAVRLLEQALALDPEDNESQFALGQAYMQLGDTQRAADAFDRYLVRVPVDLTALNLIGYTLIGTDPERAIGYFQRYTALAPEDPNAHDSLGEGYLTAGRLEEAAAEYERAVALDAGFTNSYFMLGQVYQRMSRNDQAVAAYQRFIALTGGNDPRAGQAQAALGEMGATVR
jgi:tetratricopeptide (TPR) repeat protein